MADVIADGNQRWQWVPAIANIQLPTTTELNAGIHLTDQITRDGADGWDASTAAIENTGHGALHDTALAGVVSLGNPLLRFKRQLPTDTVRSTLTYTANGFLVRRNDLTYTNAYASGQPLSVFPVQCGRRKELKSEKNSLSRYEIPFFITAAPAYDAQVA